MIILTFARIISRNKVMMRMIDQIIAYNKAFAEKKGYEKYLTSKYPTRSLLYCHI